MSLMTDLCFELRTKWHVREVAVERQCNTWVASDGEWVVYVVSAKGKSEIVRHTELREAVSEMAGLLGVDP